MRVIQPFIKVLFLLFIMLSGTNIEAHAEKVENVTDWLEQQPEEVNKDADAKKAQAEKEPTHEQNSSVGLTLWDFLKMIMATLFVIALLYFLLRFINKKSHNYKDTQVIQNMGGASLGSNRSVQMIRVGNRVLIVGVGENIQLIKEIDDQQEAERMITEYNGKLDQMMSPSDIVTKVMSKSSSLLAKEKEKEKENASFPSILKKQLDSITNERKKLLDEMENKEPDKR